MYYCPKCRSQEIYPDIGGYAGSIYVCKDCGYRGAFVLEADPAPDPENRGPGKRVHHRPVRSHTKEG